MQSFKCPSSDGSGLSSEFLERHKLNCPDIYIDSDSMYKAVSLSQDENAAQFALVPLCHTTESDGYGAVITLTDACGARASEPVYKSFSEMTELGLWDLTSGRFATALDVCKRLKADKRKVVFNITGPLGILNCLLPASQVFKLLRQNGPELKVFFDLTEINLLSWADAAVQAGADCISYADPMAGADIAGPRYAEQLARDFSVPFLIKLREIVGNKAAISVCPKVWMSLVESGFAHDLPKCNIIPEPEFGYCQPASKGFYGRYCTKAVPPGGTAILFEIVDNDDKRG